MGVTCWALHAALSQVLPGEDVARAALKLGVTVAAGGAVTLVGARLLGVPEARDIVARLAALAKLRRRA